jgi:myo-inositol-1(or 4)-monophosphatase
VAAYVYKGESIFAVVYDPSVDELFTAEKGKGAFLNSHRIQVSTTDAKNILFNHFAEWNDVEQSKRIWDAMFDFHPYRNRQSYALSYCYVASGRFDGILSMTKDVFPEFAGSLIVNEAGGVFTNSNGQKNLKIADRLFIAGNNPTYTKLIETLNKAY